MMILIIHVYPRPFCPLHCVMRSREWHFKRVLEVVKDKTVDKNSIFALCVRVYLASFVPVRLEELVNKVVHTLLPFCL